MQDQRSGLRYKISSSERQHQQLGLNTRTASHKLNKMILVSLLYETGRCTCLRCNTPLATDNVSIEHVEEWLDASDPVERFFNLDNIEFVCKSCNSIYHRTKSEMEDPSTRKEKPVARTPIPLNNVDKPLESKQDGTDRNPWLQALMEDQKPTSVSGDNTSDCWVDHLVNFLSSIPEALRRILFSSTRS